VKSSGAKAGTRIYKQSTRKCVDERSHGAIDGFDMRSAISARPRCRTGLGSRPFPRENELPRASAVRRLDDARSLLPFPGISSYCRGDPVSIAAAEAFVRQICRCFFMPSFFYLGHRHSRGEWRWWMWSWKRKAKSRLVGSGCMTVGGAR